MNNYVPLHVHTSRNSIGDSILKLKDYINKAKELGLKSLCITGHGSLADMYDFYFLCKEEGIQPIIGAEIYLTPDMNDKTKDSLTYHMILIAKNNIGLKNLINIVSTASLEGFYKKPRIDLNYISQYNEGLICLTACDI
jgi:DNA polymerase-3 subunit alpha